MTSGTRKSPDGRQARWEQHNRARRQVIIDAAIERIATSGPGEEVNVHQIAERAALSRTVVYRHFTDRLDLDRAVQDGIVELIRTELAPALRLEGTPMAIIRRVVAAYVGWSVDHQALHRFVERGLGEGGVSAMDRAVSQIARQIEGLIVLTVDTLHVQVEPAAAKALDPLMFGLVGAAFNTVRRWLSRPVLEPTREELVDLLSETVWHQISGLAAVRGLVLDPDVPVEDLIEAATTTGEPA